MTSPVEFKVDKTPPNTPSMPIAFFPILPLNDFSVPVSGDGDQGGSGNTCKYHASDSGAGWTKSWASRTCNSNLTITVGPDKDCRTPGGLCTVHVFAQDGAGNVGGNTAVTFQIGKSVCLKKTTPLPSDTISITVPTVIGSTAETKSCTVSVTHSGQDLTDLLIDGGAVKYERKTPLGSPATIEMDDAPVGVGSCDLDVLFKTSWEFPSQGTLKVFSVAEKKEAANDLSFGYQLNTSTCVFTSAIKEGSCASDVAITIGENPCDAPTLSPDKRTATKKHGIKGQYSSLPAWGGVRSSSKLTFVECTTNAHCSPGSGSANSDANTNTAKCNTGIPTLPSSTLNTCVDSVPPSTVIEPESQFSPVPGKRFSDDTRWLKEGTYEIFIGDADGGSGLDICTIVIRDNGVIKRNELRTCNSVISLKVGPKNDTTADCKTEDVVKCRIDASALDKAGNQGSTWIKFLNIDLTPPTAQ